MIDFKIPENENLKEENDAQTSPNKIEGNDNTATSSLEEGLPKVERTQETAQTRIKALLEQENTPISSVEYGKALKEIPLNEIENLVKDGQKMLDDLKQGTKEMLNNIMTITNDFTNLTSETCQRACDESSKIFSLITETRNSKMEYKLENILEEFWSTTIVNRDNKRISPRTALHDDFVSAEGVINNASEINKAFLIGEAMKIANELTIYISKLANSLSPLAYFDLINMKLDQGEKADQKQVENIKKAISFAMELLTINFR